MLYRRQTERTFHLQTSGEPFPFDSVVKPCFAGASSYARRTGRVLAEMRFAGRVSQSAPDSWKRPLWLLSHGLRGEMRQTAQGIVAVRCDGL